MYTTPLKFHICLCRHHTVSVDMDIRPFACQIPQAFPLYFCILQAIKNWRCRRPWNESKCKVRSLVEWIPYSEAVNPFVSRMGAGDLDHRQFAQQCDLYTGGLHISPHVTQHHTNLCGYDQGVLLSSHCLDRHLPYMLALWEDVFTR